MTTEIICNKIREIVDNTSLRLSVAEACAVISSTNQDSCSVVMKKAIPGDMEKIASVLSSYDFVVSYIEGSNFLSVQENPSPTPDIIPNGITKIPISFDEGVQLAQKYSSDVEVITDGHHATVVCKKNWARPILSELAYELCFGGLLVKYIDGCNFIEYEYALPKQLRTEDVVTHTPMAASM